MPSSARNLAFAVSLGLAPIAQFGLRYQYVSGPSRQQAVINSIGGDALDYLQIAWTLTRTGEYGRPEDIEPSDIIAILDGEAASPASAPVVMPDGWRPPVWPMVIALVLRLSGYSLPAVFLARFLLDALTLVLFAYLLLRLELHWVSRIIALGIFATHPTWLIYPPTLLSEPLTMLLQVALSFRVRAPLIWAETLSLILVANSLVARAATVPNGLSPDDSEETQPEVQLR